MAEEVMAQMEKVGVLPSSGLTLYYAEPGTFTDPGYYVWDPVKRDHVKVKLLIEEPDDGEQ